MFKKIILLLGISALLLCACNKKEDVVEPVYVPISIQAEESALDDILVPGIGGVCGFNSMDDAIEIYPYYDYSSHIYLRKILISENSFWDTIISSQSDDYILTVSNKYTLITTPSGVSYGYYPIDDEWALLAETRGLNSGYLRLFMDKLWEQNT